MPRYNCCIKKYPDGRENIKVFSLPIFNDEKDNAPKLKHITNEDNKEYERQINSEGIRMDNLKRAKEKVFDIAFENYKLWRYMITFTLDKEKIDRYDKDIINEKFRTWLSHSVSRKYLNYVLVAEPHKDGAIHFHGLISSGLKCVDSGLLDEDGRHIFDVLDYPFGFARAVPIDEGTETNCCKYITKYMTKDFTRIFGKMYWSGGKDLKRDVETVYTNVRFDDIETDSRLVPNTSGLEVKYILKGASL